MMTAIPSDFDYSVLFSDTTIPASDPVPYGFEDDIPPSDIYADSDTQQLPPASDSFQDDVEAINEVQNERREELNRRGIVIQHRLWDERPLAIFRSSSLPPG